MSRAPNPVNRLKVTTGTLVGSFLAGVRAMVRASARGATPLHRNRVLDGIIVNPISNVHAPNHESVRDVTFQSETLVTHDAVPTTVVINVAWVSTMAEKQTAIVKECGAVFIAGRAALLALVGSSTLAELLLSRPLFEDRLRRELTSALADFGLAMRAVTVREVQIPAAIQAEGDTRQQLAMHDARVAQSLL